MTAHAFPLSCQSACTEMLVIRQIGHNIARTVHARAREGGTCLAKDMSPAAREPAPGSRPIVAYAGLPLRNECSLPIEAPLRLQMQIVLFQISLRSIARERELSRGELGTW
jgi:hypothetical protein